jgi:hypothetical protein
MLLGLLVGALNGLDVPDRPPSIGRAAAWSLAAEGALAPGRGHADGLRKRMNELNELPAGVLRFQNIKA